MKKEIILTLLTFIFLSIGAYFCYKKKIEINDIKSPVNSFLYINYDNNYINSNIDFLDKKTTLKSKAYITYETNGSSDVCLNYILKIHSNTPLGSNKRTSHYPSAYIKHSRLPRSNSRRFL